jgi:aspartate 1-decarboxylase
MLIHALRCKLHQPRVTRIELEYEGSLGVSRELLDAIGLLEYERVLVANLENASRWETYIIPLEEPGQIFINGASAHFCKLGDRLIVMAWCHLTPEEMRTHKPRKIVLDENNRQLV